MFCIQALLANILGAPTVYQAMGSRDEKKPVKKIMVSAFKILLSNCGEQSHKQKIKVQNVSYHCV